MRKVITIDVSKMSRKEYISVIEKISGKKVNLNMSWYWVGVSLILLGQFINLIALFMEWKNGHII